MIDVVWLIPALPLAGFLVLVLTGRRLGEPKAGYLATATQHGLDQFTVLTDTLRGTIWMPDAAVP